MEYKYMQCWELRRTHNPVCSKIVIFVFCFKHCECLSILPLGLSVQTDEALTISQDKGGRHVFKTVFSRERSMDLAPTHLTLKKRNLKSQFVILLVAQLDLTAWFPVPCLSRCFSCS